MAYAIIIFAVLFADQLSKALIFAFNVEGLTIIPGLLALDKTMNTGMAFGMLGDKEWAIPVFIAVTSVAMVVFLVLLVKTKPSRRFMRTALALILCGALGNFIDRVVLEGVRDFIALSVGNISFLNFNCNVADIAFTAGAVMLILDLLFIDEDAIFRFGKKDKEKRDLDDAAGSLKKDVSDSAEQDG